MGTYTSRTHTHSDAVQKLMIEMGSIWSAWISTPVDSPACLHVAMSSSPVCLVRMHTGTENWVRSDDRRLLQDVTTCNLLVLQHDDVAKIETLLATIMATSTKIKSVAMPAPISYRNPELVARADAYREEGQQKRIPADGVGLFVRLKKAKTEEEKRMLDIKCAALHHANKYQYVNLFPESIECILTRLCTHAVGKCISAPAGVVVTTTPPRTMNSDVIVCLVDVTLDGTDIMGLDVASWMAHAITSAKN